MIPCSNPRAQNQSYQEEIRAAFDRVLEQGRYILGPEVAAFEREFADYIGVAHGVGVGSGTEALHLALAALGVGPGDEVITTAHTAVATAAAIRLVGATPVFADIDPAYYTLDAKQVEAAITPRTKAIIAVHLYGQAADLGALLPLARARGLKLIEDCAQCHGARWREGRLGAHADIACFSFYPTKNLGAIGDGGMVVTASDELNTALRLYREYGWAERYVSHTDGWNSRLDELQAAILRIKLRGLDRDNARRARIAAIYDAGLQDLGLALPAVRAEASHAYHLYVVRSARRDALQQYLASEQINTLVHYPVPIHQQPAYLGGPALPHTEQAAREVLSLPMYPELPEADAHAVVAAIARFAALPPA